MKKPWERGYIPQPGPKPVFKNVETPEGWERGDRTDCVEFFRPSGKPGSAWWGVDVIIGKVGKPWRLWINHNAGVFRQPDMAMPSLKALLVWYQVELSNCAPEPRRQVTQTGRQVGKSAMLAAAYGAGRKQIMAACGLPDALVDEAGTLHMLDFKVLEYHAARGPK